MERGDLRIIYTDAPEHSMPSLRREEGEHVWALVGPIGQHVSHPELQNALGLVAMAFNRRHGRLSAAKHRKLVKNHEDGAELLREALAVCDSGRLPKGRDTK